MALHPLEYETLQVVRARRLLAFGDSVVVGVSGGLDSMALLRVLAALRLELDLDLTVVYVDHGLRPLETRAEERLVADQAMELQVTFRTGRVAVEKQARKSGQSLEEAGRELRYDFLHKEARESSGAVIAVAHHADDQAEEILLRFLKGSGRAGLSGMSWINSAGVVRPFLGFSKERLRNYLQEQGGDFLEDSSNSDRRFRRNRVRLDLLPYLEKNFNPKIRQSLCRTADILSTEEELLNELTDRAFERVAIERIYSDEGPLADEILLDTVVLNNEPLALQRRVLECALVEVGAQASFQFIGDILALAGRNAGELHLPRGLRILLERGLLRFCHPAGRINRRGRLEDDGLDLTEVVITGPGLWGLGERDMSVLVELLEVIPDRQELLQAAGDYLDAATVKWPLVLRNTREGDRFHPLGGPGSRKVSDFLSDRKIPRKARKEVLVMESSGRICALPGHRIDQRCRLTGNTETVLKVSLVKR